MLLYVESKAFPCRTFIVRVKAFETIARVRAQVLHILYELGREDHQFRLRFKGQYLRDAFTIEDYGIVENAIVKMVPLSKNNEHMQSLADLKSLHSGVSSELSRDTLGPGIMPDIKMALESEISIFNKREKYIFHFKGIQYLMFLAACLCFLSTYWYSAFWSLAIFLGAVLFCPIFTRLHGFIGGQSVYKTEFCIVYGVFSFAAAAVHVYFCVSELTKVIRHGCSDLTFTGECSHKIIFSGALYAIQALLFLVSGSLAWALLWNMKIEYGDFIEKYLVQSRDIEEVMKAAEKGGTKERRVAAFELATMAASSDDNKFRIVAEGGLEVLIRMALSKDEATQEHSVEALAELMTVPAIQDNFVEMGGVKTLTALLHSSDHRCVYQALTAISYIVSDSDDNQYSIVADHGLDDLAFASKISHVLCQRILSGIYLELAFNSEIRNQMASLNSPAQAMIALSRSKDQETQRFALQTLELLAIESPDMICAQEELLPLLLELPLKAVDSKVYILAGKLLLYYSENRTTCEILMDSPLCKNSLQHYARTKDPIVQKVVVKVIFCMLEMRELKYRARHLEMDEVLKYVRDHASDRETWDMADQALQFMYSDEDSLQNLPSLSTMDKINKMDGRVKVTRLGADSHNSTGSRTSLRSTLSGDSITKKPLE